MMQPLRTFILLFLGVSGFLQGMNFQDIKARNEKLLAEDALQAVEHKTPALAAHQAPIAAKTHGAAITQREPYSACLREYALPLSCLLFTGLLATGGVFCKQSPTCNGANYDTNSNGTATNSTMLYQPHTSILTRQQSNTALFQHVYPKTKKYMLHPIKHRRWATRKK